MQLAVRDFDLSNALMAKKKKTIPAAESAPESRDRRQYLVSCPTDESELFERVSAIEGDKTVQQWWLRLARIRARKVLEAEENGTLDQL